MNRTFGRKALVVYLSTIITASVGLGLLYEYLFGSLQAVQLGAAHDHNSWVAQTAVVVLLGLFAWFAGEELRGRWSAWRTAGAVPGRVEIPVSGMTCSGCASRLQRVLSKQAGVDGAAVSFDAGTAVVVGMVDLELLHAAIRQAGFDPHDAA